MSGNGVRGQKLSWQGWRKKSRGRDQGGKDGGTKNRIASMEGAGMECATIKRTRMEANREEASMENASNNFVINDRSLLSNFKSESVLPITLHAFPKGILLSASTTQCQ